MNFSAIARIAITLALVGTMFDMLLTFEAAFRPGVQELHPAARLAFFGLAIVGGGLLWTNTARPRRAPSYG